VLAQEVADLGDPRLLLGAEGEVHVRCAARA